MFSFTVKLGRFQHLALVAGLVLVSSGSQAAETDNYYLPPDKEFADLGDFLEALHTQAIQAGVEEVNSRIERALKLKDPESRQRRLEQHQSVDVLVAAVAAQFGDAPSEAARIESMLKGRWARDAFPDQAVRHHDISMNLKGRGALDPRALLMFSQSSTIKAFDVYFGTDKLVHFHQLGQKYYKRYRELLQGGADPAQARLDVIEHYAEKAFFAEDKGFGTIVSGIYSNADMAANYLGFKFLLNLTEPVVLEGMLREPLLLRCGDYWYLAGHVRLHSGWFRPFIGDHWNEALNPNLYDSTMHPRIREILEDRAGRIVEFYTVRDGRPEDPDYYGHLALELSDYYGEPYGHSGQFEKLMHLGNTCIPALQEPGNQTNLVRGGPVLGAVETD